MRTRIIAALGAAALALAGCTSSTNPVQLAEAAPTEQLVAKLESLSQQRLDNSVKWRVDRGSDDGYRTLKLLPTYRDRDAALGLAARIYQQELAARDGMPAALTRENWDDVRHAIANVGGVVEASVALTQFFDLYENDEQNARARELIKQRSGRDELRTLVPQGSVHEVDTYWDNPLP